MKLVVVAMVALAATVAACRDEPKTGTTTTTSSRLVEEPTAGSQPGTDYELDTTAAVRRKLVADPRLSVRAKNVVVVVKDGVLTLRGDVASKADHDALLESVVSVPGVSRVDDRTNVMDDEGETR